MSQKHKQKALRQFHRNGTQLRKRRIASTMFVLTKGSKF